MAGSVYESKTFCRHVYYSTVEENEGILGHGSCGESRCWCEDIVAW